MSAGRTSYCGLGCVRHSQLPQHPLLVLALPYQRWSPPSPFWMGCQVSTLVARTTKRHLLDRASSSPSGSSAKEGEIALLCEQGHVDKALDALSRMEQQGIVPAMGMYRSILKGCIARKALAQAKRVHAHLARRGLELTGTLGEYMVNTLIKCGSLEDALEVFSGLPHRTVVSWTIVISAHCKAGRAHIALEMYHQMREEGVQPDKYTFISLFKACSTTFDLGKGKYLHAELLETGCEFDLFVGTGLVDMYAKCGSILDAEDVFDKMLQRDVVCWNAMLTGYAQQGLGDKALQLYGQMLEDGVTCDDRTYVSLLQACGSRVEKEEVVFVSDGFFMIDSLHKGKAIHSEVWRRSFHTDVFVGSTLISMYGKCGSSLDARDVFDRLSQRNLVSWAAMIAAYVEQGQAENALQLYEQMQEEGVSANNRTFVSVLQACSILAAEEDAITPEQSYRVHSLHWGRAVHAQARRVGYGTDPFVGSALISMYAKCGSIVDAQNVFDMMPHKDVVTWTALLTAYASHGQADMALQLYELMQDEGINPDDAALVCILQACSTTGNLHVCSQIHCHLKSTRSALSLQLASIVIHAYGTCSRMKDARDVFNELPHPDLVCWNALIAGYARQGSCAESLQCYDEMQLAGMKPDGVTFLSLLAACSHAGEVDRGVKCFQSMTRDSGITPEFEHYVSMVDLLGRAGHFTMVQDLLSTMPMQAGLPLWLCLLGACQKHGNVVLGERVFNLAVQLRPTDPAAYMLASNMYAHAGMWEKVRQVDGLRQSAGAWKKPGICWIENEQEVHKFLPGDWHDQEYTQLYNLLGELVSTDLEGLNGELEASDQFDKARLAVLL